MNNFNFFITMTSIMNTVILIGILSILLSITRLLKQVKSPHSNDIYSIAYEVKKISPFIKESVTTKKRIVIEENKINDTLMIFISPDCLACKQFLEDEKYIEKLKGKVDLLFISEAATKEKIDFYKDILRKMEIPLVVSDDLSKSLNIPAFPFAVLINNQLEVMDFSVATAKKNLSKIVAA
ncbi:hypothetical protein ACH0BF_16760 [Pseudobacillus sp. 179-B 2D1 NHS]|uniref:hypothetical protein n=1 Tax=Pseudobacillus sp. 179-B 2D1 NHS TaxID=3374292 RepID=UPI00387A820F